MKLFVKSVHVYNLEPGYFLGECIFFALLTGTILSKMCNRACSGTVLEYYIIFTRWHKFSLKIIKQTADSMKVVDRVTPVSTVSGAFCREKDKASKTLAPVIYRVIPRFLYQCLSISWRTKYLRYYSKCIFWRRLWVFMQDKSMRTVRPKPASRSLRHQHLDTA